MSILSNHFNDEIQPAKKDLNKTQTTPTELTMWRFL